MYCIVPYPGGQTCRSWDTAREYVVTIERLKQGVSQLPRKLFLWLSMLLPLFGSGCVSTPQVELSPGITAGELSDHVHFLAQPRLKGRKPWSYGSAASRKYIVQRFEALGLVPWGDARKLTQPFIVGTNVVGVLPGSDPNLAREVVILSAHYDHLGRTEQGMCLGACDNASGVAALLEIAESLSMKDVKPRRTICFAAFDQEEKGLLGAFAFSCREDFDPNCIAGVVNVDALGRKGFEVLENHLFLSGTADYRDLRQQIQTSPTKAITILPAGTDIAGPRGDHAAFEGLGFPSLFYCCGLYKDYHRSGDTPDKLDYHTILRSAGVIENTVTILANRDKRFEPVEEATGDMEELRTLNLCLDRLREHLDVWLLADTDANSIQRLSVYVKGLLAGDTYTPWQRERLVRRAAIALSPVISRFEPDDTPQSRRYHKADDPEALALAEKRLLLLEMMELGPLIGRAGRTLMRQLPDSSARLLWPLPKTNCRDALASDLYMDFQSSDEDRCQLVFMVFGGEVSFHWPGLLLMPWFKRPGVDIQVDLKALAGSRQEIVDACLLMWKGKREEGIAYDRVIPVVLRTMTEETGPDDYDAWMAARLKKHGWQDESAWLEHMMQSPNANVAKQAILLGKKHLGNSWEPLVQRLLADTGTRSETKYDAIEALGNTGTQQTLFALVGLLHDEGKRTRISYAHRFNDPNHPILELMHLSTEYVRLLPKSKPKKSRAKPKPSPATLGDLALKKLKTITGEDFGKDTQAWKDWIEKHGKE